MEFNKVITWYLGVTERDKYFNQVSDIFLNNKQLSLIEDELLVNKYKSYMDVSNIPSEYKTGRKYYEDYEKIKDTIYEKSALDNKKVIALCKQAFNPNISPLLADRKYLVGLPKSYFIIFEWDELKDDGLLYVERLKQANVDVKVAFYEKAFHGMHCLIQQSGFQSARDIQNDLIEHLKLVL